MSWEQFKDETRDWFLIMLLLIVVLGIAYLWGRNDGIRWTTEEICREPVAQYYEEVCR